MTDKIDVKVYKGSALNPYIFDLVMDAAASEVKEGIPWSMLCANSVLGDASEDEVEKVMDVAVREVKEGIPWGMLFANSMLGDASKDEVEKKLERCTSEEQGPKIRRNTTKWVAVGSFQYLE